MWQGTGTSSPPAPGPRPRPWTLRGVETTNPGSAHGGRGGVTVAGTADDKPGLCDRIDKTVEVP